VHGDVLFWIQSKTVFPCFQEALLCLSQKILGFPEAMQIHLKVVGLFLPWKIPTVALPSTLKSILMKKKNYENSKYFTMQKYNLQKQKSYKKKPKSIQLTL
jgi:hypothetical protein